jgi:hypothetical protein
MICPVCKEETHKLTYLNGESKCPNCFELPADPNKKLPASYRNSDTSNK